MQRLLLCLLLCLPLCAEAQTASPVMTVAIAPPLATTINGASQTAFTASSITTTNTYQQIAAAGSCGHGGFLENTSGTGGALIWIDWSTGVTSGGTSLGNGATGVGPALTSGQPGGKQTIPPTANALFVYGASGVTFHGSCS
jgi:hypothetical protein